MMMTLFGHELERGFEIAVEVDTNGWVSLWAKRLNQRVRARGAGYMLN